MPNNLKFWRERKDISQADLARTVGVTRQALSSIEAQKQYPSIQLALKLARILDVPLEHLFHDEDKQMESTKTNSLTKQERLALVNQFRILQGLHKDDSYLAKHYQRLEEIVQRGYENLYHEIFDSMWKPMPNEDSEEVISILCLHRALYDSLGSVPNPAELERVKFQGFDANNESEYLSFARFFTADGDRFSEIQIFNSHCPTLARYRKMLAEWNRLGNNPRLSKAQVESILEAGTFKH